MKIFIVFILIYSISFYVEASKSDNLKPDGSILTEFDFHSTYKTSIRKTLINNLSKFPIARTLVCPSFSPEYLISIERKKAYKPNNVDNSYTSNEIYLIYRTCKPSIWSAHEKNPESIRVTTKEIIIDSDFANLLERLFTKALSQAKFSFKSDAGLDGTEYYFMVTVMLEGTHCGNTWSPEQGTKMYDLANISELLKQFGESNDLKVKNEIIIKAKKLIIKFDDKGLKESKDYERYIWIAIVFLLISLIFIIRRKKNES